MEYASRQHSCLSYLWLDLLGHHLLQMFLLILPQLVQWDWKSSSFLLPEVRALRAEKIAASSEPMVSTMVFVRTWKEINLEHSYRNGDTVSLEWNLKQKWRMEFTVRIVVLRQSSLAARPEWYFDTEIYFQINLNWYHRHLPWKFTILNGISVLIATTLLKIVQDYYFVVERDVENSI